MYVTQVEELPSKNERILDNPLLFYVYLFRRNSGKEVIKNALGNSRIFNTIPRMDLMHMDVCKVYKQEVCLEALHAIILPLVANKISIVSIFNGGTFSLLGLLTCSQVPS
jgi:hypothetical protein